MNYNILQLHASAGLYGGESVILSLGKALNRLNCNTTIGCFAAVGKEKPALGLKATQYGLNVSYLPMGGKFDISVVTQLVKLIRKNSVSLIHAHGYKSNILGAIAAKIAPIPIISTNHLFPMMPLDDRKLQMYGQIDVKITSKLLDKIIAVSEDIKNRLILAGVQESKVTIIENGIDIDEYASANCNVAELKKALRIHNDSIVVGSLARLTEQKGQIYLLEAASKLIKENMPLVIVIAGDGPLKNHLMEHADKLGIADNVKFLGFRSDTRNILKIMDIFVLSSIDEGLPMAMLEAMAARVSVITSRVGDIPKVITNHKNGIMVEPRSSDQLAKGIRHLMQDIENRKLLVENAYETVSNNYSHIAMASKYMQIYKEMIKQ